MSAREDFTDHVMPSGAVCYYRDGDHSYWGEIKPKSKKPDAEWSGVRDSRLIGVSTGSKPFDYEPDQLMNWAAKTNGVGIAQLVADSIGSVDLDNDTADRLADALLWCESDVTIWQALDDGELTWRHLRDQRADEGTNVHKHALYALASGKPVPDYHELTDIEVGYAQGIVKFWLEQEPVVHEAEQIVLDLTLGVAGRFDLRCDIGGRTVLVDAKTSGFIPVKHHVQLAGYEHCARVSGFGWTEAQFILQVTPDGEYELVPSHGEAEDFFVAVDAYRRSKRIAKDAADDRKAVTA